MEGKGKEIAVGSSIDESSVESHKYYGARRTTLEMLRDRGYDVSDKDINLSFQDFRALYGERTNLDQIRIFVKHSLDSSKKMVVVFCGSDVVKVNDIRVIAFDVLYRKKVTGLILVKQSGITDQALKAIELFSFKVELFQITELLVNVSKHVMVPKHQILTDTEKESLLKKFNIEEKQLPRLLKKDPIVRYYGLEKGQVMKFIYNDELNKSRFTYRCVS